MAASSLRSSLVAAGLGAVIGGAAAWILRGRKEEPPRLVRVHAALDRANALFHEHYGAARAGAALSMPVFIVLADGLVLVRREQRQRVGETPRLYHLVKSIAHVPIALYALLARRPDGPPDDTTRARLGALVRAARRSLMALPGGDPDIRENLRTLLQTAIDLGETVLATGVEHRALRDFARQTGPRLLASTVEATRLQLSALEEGVRRGLELMTDEERRSFHVVVTGDHQARQRNLGMQFFQKLLGAEAKERLTYGEGIVDTDAAIELLGNHRLDRDIAAAFFDDPSRLQRDVLGDAARDLLEDADDIRRLVTLVPPAAAGDSS